ncbi:MAG: AfsR/SARP family transcriptional regulator [Blastocatellia bacterium]
MKPKPSGKQADWQLLFDLIENGLYDQAAERLGGILQADRPSGDSDLTDLLGAIRQLCFACNQFQSEAIRHKRAGEEASNREVELKRKLRGLLELAGERKTAASAPASPVFSHSSESTQPSWLWERIQTMLKLSSDNKHKSDAPAVASPAALEGEFHVEPASAALVVHCFGPFRVFRHDRLITPWHSHKSLVIFKYLIKHYGTPVSKEILMDVFWPDADSEAARPNLHQAIYSLRQTLRRGSENFQPIRFENDCYSIKSNLHVWIDAVEFDKHLQAGRRMESAGRLDEAVAEYRRAESLYLGDFLEEDIYEDWAALPREQYRNAYFDLAERLSQYFQQQGDYPPAIEMCQKILAKDSCHERAHYRLMQCYQKLGRRSCAARQYQICVKALKDGLDVLPSVETTSLFEEIVHGGRSFNLSL